jgi:DNA polymerase I
MIFMYVIGPKPSVKAERVDLVSLVRRGFVYAEFSGAVWRVAEPARRWETRGPLGGASASRTGRR